MIYQLAPHRKPLNPEKLGALRDLRALAVFRKTPSAIYAYNITPATHATRHVASRPPIIARNASREMSPRRSGASPE